MRKNNICTDKQTILFHKGNENSNELANNFGRFSFTLKIN